ncbi:DUF397 domain-containing protein [Streptomyces sp. NPDC059070]|uniref:DUF397 domain-containing protein n=1 Tax=Streptomyces sp. NPDC059070 TaxID=3346713 RepID=UPI0036D1CBF8
MAWTPGDSPLERAGVKDCWTWRKASWSDGAGNQCVEVAWTGRAVLVRDSKEPERAHLHFAPSTWEFFLTSAVAEGRTRRF